MDGDTGSGFRTGVFVFLLCRRSRIKMLFKSTLISGSAAVADIRGSGKRGAVLLKVIRAKKMAFGAEGAFLKVTGRVGAEVRNGAAEAVGAVIERTAKATGLFENEVGTDLFRDSSAVAT